MAPLRPLNHWMLQDDLIARQFDQTLLLTPYYDPVRLPGTQKEIAFFASLVANVDSAVGGIKGNFARNSEAIYRAPMGASLAVAGDDISRHAWSEQGEQLGILMEAAVTNKCRNYNANPDPGLINHTVLGPGDFSRVQDPQKLAEAGLQNVCDSGWVYKLDNSAGGSNATVYISGDVGNTNEHICSFYAYKDPASVGGGTFLQMEGTQSKEFFNTDHFRRIDIIDTPSTGTRRLGCIVEPGAIAYWVLNQLEESFAITTPVITRGEAASRALDLLDWPLNSILNQAEGMAAIEWQPAYDPSAWPNANQFTDLLTVDDRLMSFLRGTTTSRSFRSYSGATFAEIGIPGGDVDPYDQFLVMVRWKDDFQIGYKKAGEGVVRWSAPQPFGGFAESGRLKLNDKLSASSILMSDFLKNAYIWRVDNGTAWLEDFFSGVAN